MSIQCMHCAHEISVGPYDRPPPWCPHCGADLKVSAAAPALAVAAPALTPAGNTIPAGSLPDAQDEAVAESPPPIVQSAGEPWDGQTCAACGTTVDVADWSETSIAFCPECGQCLKAPAPWPPTLPAGYAAYSCLSNVRDKTKYPGSVGLMMGAFAIAAGWGFPGINTNVQWALTMLGGALAVEGLGRIRAEARRQQPRRRASSLEMPQDAPDKTHELGSLQAVFQTHNSWVDSLAIALLGLALGFGGLYLLEWVGAGFLSGKLLAGAVFAPLVALYLAYRAARNLCDRRCVLIFAGGLLYQHGNQVNAYPWNRIGEITRTEIGDAIDEKAVEIRLRNGLPPLRFTCAHFRNLEQFAARLEEGRVQQIDSLSNA